MTVGNKEPRIIRIGREGMVFGSTGPYFDINFRTPTTLTTTSGKSRQPVLPPTATRCPSRRRTSAGDRHRRIVRIPLYSQQQYIWR